MTFMYFNVLKKNLANRRGEICFIVKRNLFVLFNKGRTKARNRVNPLNTKVLLIRYHYNRVRSVFVVVFFGIILMLFIFIDRIKNKT